MLMIAQGLSITTYIDTTLFDPKTVHTTRYGILKKLGVKNDVGLTLLATRLGLIENMEVDD